MNLEDGFYSEIKQLLEKYKSIKPALIVTHVGDNVPYELRVNYQEDWNSMPLAEILELPRNREDKDVAYIINVEHWVDPRGWDQEGKLSKILEMIRMRFFELKSKYLNND